MRTHPESIFVNVPIWDFPHIYCDSQRLFLLPDEWMIGAKQYIRKLYEASSYWIGNLEINKKKTHTHNFGGYIA